MPWDIDATESKAGTTMGRAAPDHVIGVHVNAATFGFIPLGPVSDNDKQTMTPVEKQRLQRL
jgi:epoxide hydrolase